VEVVRTRGAGPSSSSGSIVVTAIALKHSDVS
jgi:hypothetical protein